MDQRPKMENREHHRQTRSPAGRRRRQPKLEQQELFARSWGGARRGAGRKPKGDCALVSHAERTPLAASHPVHVTTRLLHGLPSLRRTDELRVLLRAIGSAQERSGMRVVHYSIQTNHLHLMVEASGRESLALGIQGLLVRIARGLNRLWRRSGRIFVDRYHAHELQRPAEVRRALVYVLQNARKHRIPLTGVDAYSSGPWFEGWSSVPGLAARLAGIRRRLAGLLAGDNGHGGRGREEPAQGVQARTLAPQADPAGGMGPIARPQTWLLARGWMRGGTIGVDEMPVRVGARARPAAVAARVRS